MKNTQADKTGKGAIDPICPDCGARYGLSRTCLAVYVRCRVCGTTFPLNDKSEILDDKMEEELAFVPLDRI